MALKKTAAAPEVSGQSEPEANGVLLFADSLMQLGVGPFVSKVVLGSQVGENSFVPQIQLVMPSNALLFLAQRIIELYGQEHTMVRFEESHAQFRLDMSGPPKPKQRKKTSH